MICKIHGVLESLDGGAAQVTLGNGLTYELLLPAFVAARLGPDIGKPVTLHTIHYLEGSSQGNNFTPRLAAFIADADRRFFQMLTSVKGIGSRKALRAMTLPSAQIAAAIADRDVKTLQSLPEIGKRMAETIVATLHGKVDAFVADAYAASRSSGTSDALPASSPTAARAALEILLQLGESRAQAVQWIDQILIKQPDIDDPQVLIAEVFRVKASG